jgi:hypothetical protein
MRQPPEPISAAARTIAAQELVPGDIVRLAAEGSMRRCGDAAAMIVLVLRSRGPLWNSRPSRGLALATVAVIGATLLLPAALLPDGWP